MKSTLFLAAAWCHHLQQGQAFEQGRLRPKIALGQDPSQSSLMSHSGPVSMASTAKWCSGTW